MGNASVYRKTITLNTGVLFTMVYCTTFSVSAEQFIIQIPAGGEVLLDVPHISAAGSLVSPEKPESPSFRPPSIFSAPLPSGSGARALGVAGAFTALADDATAASWNPAGLIQLERPEISLALRASQQKNVNSSSTIAVGEEEFEEFGVNYLSGVYPFERNKRNYVLSLNLQETYDFTQQLKARFTDRAQTRSSKSATTTLEQTHIDRFTDDTRDITFTSRFTTTRTSYYDQLIQSELVSELDYRQQGVLYAISPAMAVEVTPLLSFGMAVNLHMESPISSQAVQSRTRARYSGAATSSVRFRDTQTTSGTYTYDGKLFSPPTGSNPLPGVTRIDGGGSFEPFTDTASRESRDVVYIEGEYTEMSEFDDFHGVNATLGVLWNVTHKLSLGASLDTPWTARAEQTKTVANRSVTYNENRDTILSEDRSRDVTTKDVKFYFPLSWSVGALYRWTENLYSMVDAGQTYWSDFAFEAEGEEKVNPLDGSRYGENRTDDTWSVRGGLEYLVVLSHTEIPLRCGAGWEERPAIGSPDDYYSFSLGTGLGIGRRSNRKFLDFAYIYTFSDQSSGIIQGVEDLRVDVEEHLIMMSLIWHL